MSMKQQWQIELQNAFCFKTFLAHDIYHYHHIDTVIMISILSSSLQKKTLTITKLLWAVSITWVRPSPGCQSSFFEPSAFGSPLMSTISMGWCLDGFYLFKNFSPLGIDSMICFQTQWILSIFSWIFINRFEPSMTVDHKKTITTKKWHYQIMVILFTVRQKNHESDLEDSLCGLVDVEHIRSWRVELLDIERQREFWSRGSRYI